MLFLFSLSSVSATVINTTDISEISEDNLNLDKNNQISDQLDLDEKVSEVSKDDFYENSDGNRNSTIDVDDVLKKSDDDLLSTADVISSTVGTVTIHVEQGDHNHNTLTWTGVVNGYSSTAVSTTNSKNDAGNWQHSANLVFTGAFKPGVEYSITITANSGHTYTKQFTVDSKASISPGTVNSINYNYADSASFKNIFSGRFLGKLGQAPLTKTNGAIIYRNGVQVATVNVDENGNWAYRISSDSLEVGSYNFTVKYDGNDYYNSLNECNLKTVIVSKGKPIITINPVISSDTYPGNVTVEVIVKNGMGVVFTGVVVSPKGNAFIADNQTTDTNGKVSFTVNNLNAGTYSDWNVETTMIDTSHYETISYTNIPSFTINQVPTTVTGNYVLIDNLAPGKLLVNITVRDSFGNPLKNIPVEYSCSDINGNGTTNDEGMVAFDLTGFSGGNHADLKFTNVHINYVSNTYNVPTFNIIPTDSFTKLWEAINASNNVLNLNKSYKFYDEFDSAFLTEGIFINKTITINGNGHSIDAKGKLRIFKIYGDGVVLNNLTFTNGSCPNGAALNIIGNNVVVSNSSFFSNTAINNGGGAIFVDGDGITINYCTFNDNNATVHDGGAIYLSRNCNNTLIDHVNITNCYARYIGSAIFSRSSQLTISNSYFSKNIDSSGDVQYGGTLAFDVGSNHKVINCTFENNMNYYQAAGIKVYSGSSNIDIINSTFIGNNAPNGGAISIFGEGVVISKSKFIDNTATSNGGAIYALASSFKLFDSSFINNRVTSGHYGGAIYYEGNSFEIDNCSFVGSVVNPVSNPEMWTTRGGAIYVNANNKISISNSEFINNKVNMISGNAGSGAIQFIGAPFEVTNCTFIGNRAPYGGVTNIDVTGGKFTGCIFLNNYAYVGGGVFNSNYMHYTTVSDSIIINNSAASSNNLKIFSVSTQSSITNYYLNNNWWGTNASNYNDITKVIPAIPFKSQLTRWLVLNGDNNSTNNVYLLPNTKLQMSFTLNKYYDSSSRNNGTYDASLFPTITLDIMSVGGSASIKNTTLNDCVGEEFIFKADKYPGKAGIVAKYGSLAWYSQLFTIVPIDSFMALKLIIDDLKGSTLNLTHNYKYYPEYDSSLVNGIVINKKLTINGNRYTLDAGNSMRIFNIYQCDGVVLDNITFTRAKHSTEGGAIRIDSNALNVVISNSTFKSNSAPKGGAIFSLSPNIKILNDIFNTNSASSNEGGAITILGENTLVKGCTFTSNTAKNRAGAIHVNALTYIDDCTFTSNSANNYEGAIFFNSNGKNSIVNNSRFTSNKATWGSAIGIYTSTTNVQILNSNFTKNSVSYGGAVNIDGTYNYLDNCYFEGNKVTSSAKSNSGGAGIRFAGAHNTVSNSKFIKNFVSSGYADGGAIYCLGQYSSVLNCYFNSNYNSRANGKAGAIFFAGSNGLVNNSVFTNNHAVWGGAINDREYVHNLRVLNSNFTSNYANWGGGAMNINLNSQNLKIDGCIFKNNKVTASNRVGGALRILAPNASVFNSYFENNLMTTSKSYGGAIYFDGVNAHVNNSVFINNKASYGGGAIFFNKANPIVNNSLFKYNSISGHERAGGAIFIVNSNGKVWNSEFIENSGYHGAATQLNGVSAIVYNCNFTKNKATGGNGGGIAIQGPNIKIIKSNFTNNHAGGTGGAINSDSPGDSTFVYDCYFKSNSANGRGGAIRIAKPKSLVNNSIFIQNYAPYSGAVSVESASNIILNSNFTENKATKNYGGAIHIFNNKNNLIDLCNFDKNTALFGAAVSMASMGNSLKNSNFISNTASDFGGSVYMVASNTIEGSNFTNNNALNYGGAVYVKGDNAKIIKSIFNDSKSISGAAVYLDGGNKIVISDSKFYNNVAKLLAGAVYVKGKASIETSVFNNNSAGDEGGAIFIVTESTIKNSNFTSNKVPNYGGAVFIDAVSSKIIGGVYDNNSAPAGAAVYIKSNKVTVDGSKFINHDAVNGSAIYWKGNLGVLSNSILDNNVASNYGSAIYVVGNNINLTSSNLTGNKAKLGGAIYIYGQFADVTHLNLNNNSAILGGAVYIYGLNSTISSTNFTNNTAEYGAGIFVAKNITLKPSTFTNNVASKFGGAGYSYEFIHHEGTNLTYFNPELHRDDFYAAFAKLVNDTIFVGEYAYLEVNSTHYINYGNVTLEINGIMLDSEWINNTWIRVNTTALPWGYYEPIYAVYSSIDEYNGYRAVLSLTVKRFPVNLTLINNETQINGNFSIKINETNATGNITIRFSNGFKYSGKIVNGTAIINIDEHILGGDYNITMIYDGDGIYDVYENVTSVHINKALFVPKLENNWTYIEGDVVIILPDDSARYSGNVSFIINGESYDAVVLSNRTVISLNSSVAANIYNIQIRYSGNDKYEQTVNLTTFEVRKFPTNITLESDIIDYKGNITFIVDSDYIKDEDIITGTISFEINGQHYNGRLEIDPDTNFAHVIIDVSTLPAGVYENVTVTFSSTNNRYSNSVQNFTFTIFKAGSMVEIEDYVNGTYNSNDVEVHFSVYNQTKVNITVRDSEGNIIYQNLDYQEFAYIVGDLKAGIYNITIINQENENFTGSYNSLLFEVYRIHSSLDITNIINGTFNTTAAVIEFDVVNQTSVNATITDMEGNIVYNGTVVNVPFIINNLGGGIYNITLINVESESVYSSNATALFEIYKAKSSINIINISNGVYNTTAPIVNYTGANITGVRLVIIDNKTGKVVYNKTIEGNFTISSLGAGVYNVTVINMGNNDYEMSEVHDYFEVDKVDSFVNITDISNSTYNTNNVTVKFDVINRTNVTVVITNTKTGKVITVNNVSGNQFSIGNLTAGLYNITIINNEGENFTTYNDSALFNVSKAGSNVGIGDIINGTFNCENVTVNFDITNTTSVHIIIYNNQTGDIVYNNPNFTGDIFTIGNLSAGIYNITIINTENENYTMSNASRIFAVNKASSNMTISNVSGGVFNTTNVTVKFNVSAEYPISIVIYDESGSVVYNNTNFSGNVFSIGNLTAGKYNITLTSFESDNYNASSDSILFEVAKAESNINITSVENGLYNITNTTVKFDITNRTNVRIIITDSSGDVVYNNTNFTGDILSLGNLTLGYYNITIINDDDINYNGNNITIGFKVIVPSSLIASDVNRGYNSPYDYVAIFTDELGNILNNTQVQMIVEGKVYNITTNEHGEAYLTQTTLDVGTHNITLYNPLTNESCVYKSNIVERLQENKDIIMDFSDGSYYRVRAYGDDAKPISNVYVLIKVNGISYDVKTDDNGYANLKIRLNPNTYMISAEWKDYKINRIIVKQTLKAKNVNAKKSKNLKFSATLKWSNGKAIIGKTVEFKFKGKIYTAKTNNKGLAKITIKKSILNKLKVNKKYKIKITYRNIDGGYTSINSIYKNIKIKK